MCGFTGFFSTTPKASRAEMHVTGKKMCDCLAHRGPDSDGVWQDQDLPLVLGHRRLSILDLSPLGAQPMLSASKRYVMAYNGEVYNFLTLQKDLEQAGLSFKGRSDTEVILAAIEYWGLNLALQKLNGMFAFALWDRQERQLHFARDRMGKKPLYIGWAGKTLVFGSELKALRAHPDFEAEINRDVLGQYMHLAYVPAPHCIYKDVWALPPGFRLSVDTQSLKAGENLSAQMKPYWHALRSLNEARAVPHTGSEEDIIDRFDALLTQCTQERQISDVPLGAFLSGGIDSSTVVALMQKTSSYPTKTYTIGFEESGFDEAPYAKAIAQHLGTDHHELYLKPQDTLDVIPSLPSMFDEPFGDISTVPTYLVSKFARQSVTVALSGDGGDEMLGGYNRHFWGPKIWNRMRFMPKPLRSLIASMITKIPTNRWDEIIKNQPQSGTRLHKLAGILSAKNEKEIYERLCSQWHEPVVTQAAQLDGVLDNPEWHLDGPGFAEKMMYWDTLTYLPGDILTKVDRASMAVSLECRAPLLDKRIYDFVWGLPLPYKIRNTEQGPQGKWLLRQVLHKYVPAELFERPKQGFAMPVGEWLNGALRDWAEDLLSESRIKQDGFLNNALIQESWQAHKDGRGNHATALWTALMFQAWKEEWA